MTHLDKIHHTDALTGLRSLPDASVQVIITSPPYYAKRKYGAALQVWGGQQDCRHRFSMRTVKDKRGSQGKTPGGKPHSQTYRRTDTTSGFCAKCGAWKGELGQEPSPELFVQHLVSIFTEARRVLKDDGVCFVNLGDTYWGGKGKFFSLKICKPCNDFADAYKLWEGGMHPLEIINDYPVMYLEFKAKMEQPLYELSSWLADRGRYPYPHQHVALPCGAVATVAPDYSKESSRFLNDIIETAMRTAVILINSIQFNYLIKFSRLLKKAATSHAKDQLGNDQFAENPRTVKSISDDFIAGALWAVKNYSKQEDTKSEKNGTPA